MSDTVRKIVEAFRHGGNGRYGSEAVSQLQHALQCATLARQENATDRLIAAALLHDIGHLLCHDDLPTDCESNLDDGHEAVGFAFVLSSFGPEVADPVRLHVLAKRYLCTVQPTYQERLSPTSLKSFHDQGGKLAPEQLALFEAEPFFSEALRVRKWDDAAKDPNAHTPQLESFVPNLRRALAMD